MTFQNIVGSGNTTVDGLLYPAKSTYTLPLTANIAYSVPVPVGATTVIFKATAPFMAVMNATASVTFASAGHQSVVLSTATLATDPTGLANDVTAYTASISVDGTLNAVSVVGSAAQTYTDLLTEINADLSGAVATLAIDGLSLVVTSSSTGDSSTIAITDTDLFSTLTNYDSVATAVAGSAGLSNGQQINPVGFKIAGTDTLSVITTGTGVVLTVLFY